MKINDVEYEIEGIACPKCGVLCIPTETPKDGWIYDKCWNCGAPLPPIKVKEVSGE
ncbi:MAG: hypothetical protein J7K62_02455 [Thermoplasmata archaeon]|nr:hypothetical protein [Thermoplasmata archaeon]